MFNNNIHRQKDKNTHSTASGKRREGENKMQISKFLTSISLKLSLYTHSIVSKNYNIRHHEKLS